MKEGNGHQAHGRSSRRARAAAAGHHGHPPHATAIATKIQGDEEGNVLLADILVVVRCGCAASDAPVVGMPPGAQKSKGSHRFFVVVAGLRVK